MKAVEDLLESERPRSRRPERSRRVVVRYAPSPTGVPHIGNIRTALFNYLFAKNQNGKFILRIEDTDRKRFIADSIPQIKESLKILGIDWDKIYIQSQRLPLYKNYLKFLKDKRQVYEEKGALYFRVKKDQILKWKDGLHGSIEVSSNVVEDFVIVKSDGFPTYHFASVVDDYKMQVSHVIRGDEWISSTPKHLLLYQVFDWQHPQFVHLPPILGPDKKKLSKREGARSVLEYIRDGYLPEALVNFLALLGWAPSSSVALGEGGKREKELFSLNELISEFSLDRLNKNSPILNLEKLNWFNKKYLQKYQVADLAKKVKSFSILADKIDDQHLTKIIKLVRDRLTTLADFDQTASIFFKKGKLRPPEKAKVQDAKEAILSIAGWNEESITQQLDHWINQKKLDPADFKNTLRLAVFADNTPPIYQSLAVVSRQEVLERIDDAIKKAK